MQDSSTAEVLRQCLIDLWGPVNVGEFLAFFKNVVYITNADRAASNLREEAAKRRDAGPKESRLYFPCCIHKIATITSAQFSIIDQDISRMIGLGLAMRPVGAFDLLKEVLEVFLVSQMKLVRGGVPPPSRSVAARFREAMLDLLFSGKDLASRRGRIVVQGILNGNWLSRIPEHIRPHGHCASRQDTINKIKFQPSAI